MIHAFSRTEMLLGSNALELLRQSRVAIFGIGGVGSFVAEGLVRAGIGKLILIDHDIIDITNINRQIHAMHHNIGQPKVEVMRQRIMGINPNAEVTVHAEFYSDEKSEYLISDGIDYIVDAIDTVTGKISLIVRAKQKGIPIISCMGAGNKLDPTMFELTDIYNTSIDPLAKVMRRELRKRGIESLRVVYSREEPIKINNAESTSAKKRTPGSVSWVPSVAGLVIAGEVVKDLISQARK